MDTYYDTLQVSETASDELIEIAYQALLKQCHPKRYREGREKALERMAEVVEAYGVLSCPKQRAGYDFSLRLQRLGERADKPPQFCEKTTQTANSSQLMSSERFESRPDDQGGRINDFSQKAPAVVRSDGSVGTTSVATRGSAIGRLWRGEEGLGKTFWLYGVVVMLAVKFAAFVIAVAVADDRGDMPAMIRLANNIYGSYFFFIAVCIWRAAGKHRPLSAWAITARVLCFVPIYGVALAFIIPAFNNQSHPSTSRTARPMAHENYSASLQVAPITTPPQRVASPITTPTQQVASPITATPSSQEEVHFNKIYAAHPDASQISKSAAFHSWVNAEPWRKRIFEKGTADEVIAMLHSYKNDRNRQASGQAAPAAAVPLAQKSRDAAVPQNRYPACEIYAVMSDADYAACGISPPR